VKESDVIWCWAKSDLCLGFGEPSGRASAQKTETNYFFGRGNPKNQLLIVRIKLPRLRCTVSRTRWAIRPQVLSFAETEPTPALMRHRAHVAKLAEVATATDSEQRDTGIDRFGHFAGLTGACPPQM